MRFSYRQRPIRAEHRRRRRRRRRREERARICGSMMADRPVIPPTRKQRVDATGLFATSRQSRSMQSIEQLALAATAAY